MNTMRLAGQRIIRAVLIASMLLGGLSSVGAQATRSGGQNEGIKVHGHWTIEVRNPDGSLVSHSEFENSLVDQGQLLVNLLNGTAGPTGWQIRLQGIVGNTAPAPCAGGPGCVISATTSVVIGAGGLPTFQLQGNVTANQDGTIGIVSTLRLDAKGIGTNFTSRTLDATTQKSVVNGQIIQVTVGITFS